MVSISNLRLRYSILSITVRIRIRQIYSRNIGLQGFLQAERQGVHESELIAKTGASTRLAQIRGFWGYGSPDSTAQNGYKLIHTPTS